MEKSHWQRTREEGKTKERQVETKLQVTTLVQKCFASGTSHLTDVKENMSENCQSEVKWCQQDETLTVQLVA